MNDGIYEGKAIEISMSEVNEKPQILLKFELKDGGSKIWYGYLTEKARSLTFNTLLIAGVDSETLAKLQKNNNESFPVNGRPVSLDIQTEEYNNKDYQKIKWVNEISGSSHRALASAGAIETLRGIDLAGELMAAKMAKNSMNDTGFADVEESAF
jgi:hypothetical protein